MEVIGESFGDGGSEGQHKKDSSMWNAGATRSTQLHYAVELWDMSEVENWLRSRQLARFAANFKENDVVGKVMHWPNPLGRSIHLLLLACARPWRPSCAACSAASHHFWRAVSVVGFYGGEDGGGGREVRGGVSRKEKKMWFLSVRCLCLSGPAQAHAKIHP